MNLKSRYTGIWHIHMPVHYIIIDFIVYAIGLHGYIQVQETKYVEGSVVVLDHRKFYQHLESYY